MRLILVLIFCVCWENAIAFEQSFVDLEYGKAVAGESLLFHKYYHIEGQTDSPEIQVQYPTDEFKKVYFNITHIIVRDYNFRRTAYMNPDPPIAVGKLRTKFKIQPPEGENLQLHIYIFGIYIGPCAAEKEHPEL